MRQGKFKRLWREQSRPRSDRTHPRSLAFVSDSLRLGLARVSLWEVDLLYSLLLLDGVIGHTCSLIEKTVSRELGGRP
jgi:hypothetical protein